MPKRIPRNTVVVLREEDGKKVRKVPTVGKPFEFTADEIRQFEAIMPGSLAKVTVVVEDDDDDETGGDVLNPPIAITDERGGTGDDDDAKEPTPTPKAKAAAGKAKPAAKPAPAPADDDDGEL